MVLLLSSNTIHRNAEAHLRFSGRWCALTLQLNLSPAAGSTEARTTLVRMHRAGHQDNTPGQPVLRRVRAADHDLARRAEVLVAHSEFNAGSVFRYRLLTLRPLRECVWQLPH